MKKGSGIRTFKGGVAIITGGASGIGRSLGKALAARGCEVILADINMEDAEAAASEFKSMGGKAAADRLDVTDFDAVKALVAKTAGRCGRIDYMFNNAGIAVNGRFQDFRGSDWDRCININLRGVVHGIRAVFPVMEKQGFGHIVNTASFAGVFPWPTSVAYTAVKHAVVGMSAAIRAEIAHTDIRISVICPGTIRTAIFEQGGRNGRWVGDFSEEKVEELFASARGITPDRFAEKSLKQVARNKPIIVIPSEYKLLWRLYRLSPSLAISLANIISRAIFKKVEGEKEPGRPETT